MTHSFCQWLKQSRQVKRIALKWRVWRAGAVFRSDFNVISKSNLVRLDFFRAPYFQTLGQEEATWLYMKLWAGGETRRKLFPGFHPGIYLQQHGVAREGVNPLADYLRAGRPSGPWEFGLITPVDKVKPLPYNMRIGLHIHAYYPHLLPEMLQRLERNRVRPDLLVSVPNESARREVAACLEAYEGGAVEIRVVPNRGRDIGPFLTEFGETIQQNYDLIGHVHTKETVDLKDTTGRDWYQFLLENLLGGRVPMADIILGRMAHDESVKMVFPDDPSMVGWGKNHAFAEKLWVGLGIKTGLDQELCFPVGTMFWARPDSLKALFDLKLGWEDYPEEPLPYDGSLPHALERLFGVVAASSGTILLTNVPGCTR